MDAKGSETQEANAKEDVSDSIHVIEESENGAKEITKLKEAITVKGNMIKEKAFKNVNETLKAQVERLK